MSDHAYQIQYRQEFVAGFEQRQSLLRDAVTTEAVIKGNQATFLVADSGSAEAVTRGTNGLIPARADDLNQYTATLGEWHDLVRRTRFNLFASQGDGRRIMQETTMGVINRKADDQVLTALSSGTQNTGTAVTASLFLSVRAKTILGNNQVPFDGNIWAIISPAYEAYLLQTTEFSNADYVTKMPLDTGETAYNGSPGYYNWMGVKWIVHPRVSGVGTNAEKCYMFHKSAIGHAANTAGLQSDVGYNGEQDYSYARATMDMGAKLLQNSGVVVINHDGSALAAA